jgi:hypothetical protein
MGRRHAATWSGIVIQRSRRHRERALCWPTRVACRSRSHGCGAHLHSRDCRWRSKCGDSTVSTAGAELNPTATPEPVWLSAFCSHRVFERRPSAPTVLLIHGTYHLRATRVAFRNDFCIPCNAERTAICVRTLDVVHVFWVPVAPIGFIRRWYCTACGQRPDLPRTARRSIKVLALIVVSAMALLLWSAPIRNGEGRGEVITFWGLRIASGVGVIAIARWIAVGSDDVLRRARLRSLQPSYALDCPVCHVNLLPGSPWRCPNCGMLRL